MILFVHGMGHNNDRNYWRNWALQLQNELSGQGLKLTEEQFGGVYYYDLVPGPRNVKFQDAGIIQLQMLGLKKRVEEELGSFRSPLAKELGAIRRFADAIVDNFGDIFSYLYWENTFEAVNQRLYEAIHKSPENVCLIGYSLGSIISYCALSQNKAAAQKVGNLIMLGSPLYWFKTGVTRHADLKSRPAVGRFANIAGILDIAWPQMVPNIIPVLDSNVEFSINPFNPIKGHQEYFYREEGLQAIATEIIKGWVETT